MILELLQEDVIIASYDMRYHCSHPGYISQPFTTYHIKIDGEVTDSLMTTSKVYFALQGCRFITNETLCRYEIDRQIEREI